ncbi:transcription repressor NadR [Niallia sp. NCCP-28]|uniref:transcription repressor NadR n=1 Tax=Niallia sp. NCCP-28 TaxID=2934712 RepID=UPI00208223E2|nr:transcription repressor NadR [Niallia sp. NCCP-28]GKU81421.1 transcriptional regulator [Niallia sp. NCCP-28]
MTETKKLLGDERRAYILSLLQNNGRTYTGSELAKLTNVSRQIIVGDITLLKAKNEPILATSQGYIYLSPSKPALYEKIVACNHGPERTEEELNLFVDNGVTVKDVKIEHPVYGDLTASILVSNRKEVQQFMKKIAHTNASYLSQLTEGIHLHTISASSERILKEAEEALKSAKFLIED